MEAYAVVSRALSATSSYETLSSDELVWTYTAVKQDSLFKTGQSESTTDADGNTVYTESYLNADNEPQFGIPSESFGDFSIGSWLFTFYAYKADEGTEDSYDFTVTDDDGNTTYYTVGDKYYDGSNYENTTTLNSSNSTVDVYVDLVLESEYGGIMLYGLSFVDLSGSAYELDSSNYTLGYSLVSADDENDEESITYLSESELESALGDSKDDGFSIVISSDSDDSDVFTLEPGSYTLSVYAFTGDEESDYEKIAYSTITLNVRAGIYTYVTGTLPEVTVEAVVGNISVYTDGSTTIYTLNDDTDDTIDSTSAVTQTVYYGSTDTYCRLTDTSDSVSEYVFDLNGSTYTVTAYDGSTVALEEGSTVTFKNGTLSTTSGDDDDEATLSSLYVCGATLILDNVTYNTDPTGIYVADGGEVIIKNGSKVTAAGVSAISTNATIHTDEDGNKYFDTVKITIEDSTVTATCGYSDTDGDGTNDDGDTAAILVNTNATLTITNSTITAGRQAVVVRGGTATISNSTLESEAIYESGSGYASKNWSGGNEVPYATLVVGNRNGTYYEKADVTVTDTTITMGTSSYADGIVYVAAGVGGTSGSTACETTFTYSGVTGSFGDTTYSSGDDIVDSNYYKADGSTLTINGTSK